MHRAPEPHYCFTIPSIHDDTTLNCRLYHPDSLTNNEGWGAWKKRGVAIAHPYAPMGGSMDDRVVGILVEEFLDQGYIVGTFNFRGASGCKGRTSWSGRPELDDYKSFAAFFVHYLSFLHADPASEGPSTPEQSPVSLKAQRVDAQHEDDSAVVVLAGYSYGSLILRYLPPIPTLLDPFLKSVPGTAFAEIPLRAKGLAEQTNLSWKSAASEQDRVRDGRGNGKKRGRAPSNTLAVTMGGEETSPTVRRSSRETRRSLDHSGIMSRGISIKTLKSHSRQASSKDLKRPETPKSQTSQTSTSITLPAIRYLLLSPIIPPTSTVLAPTLDIRNLWARKQDGSDTVISKHKTLIIYGGHDFFSNSKKVLAWGERLRGTNAKSEVDIEPVPDAGHFWVEEGVEKALRGLVGDWAESAASVRGA